MPQWSKLLQALGFTSSESAIYLASLELGPSPVQAIAKKAKVSRVTTYAVIEKMSQQGLMSSVTKGKKQFYSAESPERLLSYTHGRIDLMQATLQEFKSSISELKLLQAGDRPAVKYFEGKEGLKALTEDLLTAKTEVIYEIANRKEILKVIQPSFLKGFAKELDKRKIRFKGIMVSDPYSPRKYADVKIVQYQKYPFSGDIIAFGDKLAMVSYRGRIEGIIVNSQELADTFAAIFKMAWKSLQ